MEVLELSAIVFSLVEILKQAGINTRFAPLISVGIGVALALSLGTPWLIGLLAGLSASGVYAGAKATFK